MRGLSITFCLLSSLVQSCDLLENNECNSAQCMSSDEKVKKMIGALLLLIYSLEFLFVVFASKQCYLLCCPHILIALS